MGDNRVSRVYVVRDDGSSQPMTRVQCKDEDLELQRILERNPDLLPGDQIDPEDPRRWLLIKREMPVPDPNSGVDRWSVDFLFADQDAMPTFVECKRWHEHQGAPQIVGQCSNTQPTAHTGQGILGEAALRRQNGLLAGAIHYSSPHGITVDDYCDSSSRIYARARSEGSFSRRLVVGLAASSTFSTVKGADEFTGRGRSTANGASRGAHLSVTEQAASEAHVTSIIRSAAALGSRHLLCRRRPKVGPQQVKVMGVARLGRAMVGRSPGYRAPEGFQRERPPNLRAIVLVSTHGDLVQSLLAQRGRLLCMLSASSEASRRGFVVPPTRRPSVTSTAGAEGEEMPVGAGSSAECRGWGPRDSNLCLNSLRHAGSERPRKPAAPRHIVVAPRASRRSEGGDRHPRA